MAFMQTRDMSFIDDNYGFGNVVCRKIGMFFVYWYAFIGLLSET